MGRPSKNEVPELFEARIKVGGKRGDEIRTIVEKTMKKYRMKKIVDTIEFILLEYGAAKK